MDQSSRYAAALDLNEEHLIAAGRHVLCAYILKPKAGRLVLTIGNGVHGFTLDREIGEFLLTHSDLKIPHETAEFAINASNERFWKPPVRIDRARAPALADAGRPAPARAGDSRFARRGRADRALSSRRRRRQRQALYVAVFRHANLVP
jgi:hypothetical protein